MKEENEIKKRITFEISKVKHTQIKVAASALGVSIKDFVDAAIAEKINRERKKGG